MRYAHTNIVAKDWQALSGFYQNVFGCKPVGPRRDLSGQWLDDLTNIENAHIEGEHLLLPGYDQNGPTLEIFTYPEILAANKNINTFGFAHIAFEVENVEDTVKLLLSVGGSLLGSIVSKDYGDMGTGTFAYAKDPEGNLIELQSWS